MSGATTRQRRTTATDHPARVAVVVPAAEQGARKSWRRLVTAVDPNKDSAYALDGPWLEPDRAYEVPSGAVVIACDTFADHRLVRMLTAEVGGLAETKVWDQKKPLGRAVLNFIGRRLPTPAFTTVRALEVLPNLWEGWCLRCYQTVPARAGQFVEDGGRRRVAHLDGACPPRPPLRNNYAGNCHLCTGWIEAGAGHAAQLNDEQWAAAFRRNIRMSYGRWHVQHPDGACPPIPEPTPNLYDGWCRECGELVPARAGVFDNGVRHRYGCPEPTITEPTWTVHRRAGALRVGQVLQARLRPWGAELPVPSCAPGYRVLDEHGLVHAVVTVVQTLGRDARFNARVRIATPAEAVDVLAAQAQFIPDAIPDPDGFRAPWNAERIGTPGAVLNRMRATGYLIGGQQPVRGVPWVAEITGRARASYVRRFLRPNIDRSQSNSTGTRGVQYHWDLKINTVYQAYYPQTWSKARRVFLRANPDGTVREVTREEVEAWLDMASEWMYSLPPAAE